MSQKTSALLMLGLCLVLCLAAITIAAGRGNKKETGEAPVGDVSSVEATEEQKQAKASEATEPPVATPVHGSEVERQSRLAPEGYFADAVFFGSSVVTGLDLYDYDDLLAGADFYTSEDMTVLDAVDCVRELESMNYGKIYIGLGLDEMNGDKDVLRSRFHDLLDAISEKDPGCIIYLMSVTPVSKYKSENNTVYTQELAVAFNEMLQEIAEERNVYYLDVFSVLTNEDGYLPSEVTNDGIHFTPAHYEAWFDLLVSYYVPVTVAVTPSEIPT